MARGNVCTEPDLTTLLIYTCFGKPLACSEVFYISHAISSDSFRFRFTGTKRDLFHTSCEDAFTIVVLSGGLLFSLMWKVIRSEFLRHVEKQNEH